MMDVNMITIEGLTHKDIEICNQLITSGFLGDGDAHKELERQTKANVEKYGYGNWYDYCVGEWGTKWDVGGDGQTDTIRILLIEDVPKIVSFSPTDDGFVMFLTT